MDVTFKVQGGKVVRDFPRPDPGLVEELGQFPTSIVSDCQDRMNVLSSALRPLLSPKPFAGVAVTVEEVEAGNLMSHLALKLLRPGDVLVIDGKGVTNRACWGGLQTFAARRKGVRAIVIDGAIRDLDDIHRYEVPVYCRGVSPAGPHKGSGGRVNLPISCGNQVIHPGDILLGDADGLVVVPRQQAEAVLARARHKKQVEQEWFARVEKGEDTADFLGFVALAERYGIEFV